MTGAAWRTRILLVAAQLVAGVALGLIWLHWSPRSTAYLLSDSGGGTFMLPDESESWIAGDGRFVLLSLVAGVLFGLVAWRLRATRGPATVLVLAVGGVLSSLVGRTIGELLAPGSNHGAVNSAIRPPLALHSLSPLWIHAVIAVLVYTVLAGTSSDPSLGRGDAQPEPRELEPVA